MNMNLNLSLNPKVILPIARMVWPYIFGLTLVGVFGYTAYAVNTAINVKPTAAAVDAAGGGGASAPKITFDKTTILELKKLSSVSGEVPTGSLGTSDPFR